MMLHRAPRKSWKGTEMPVEFTPDLCNAGKTHASPSVLFSTDSGTDSCLILLAMGRTKWPLKVRILAVWMWDSQKLSVFRETLWKGDFAVLS